MRPTALLALLLGLAALAASACGSAAESDAGTETATEQAAPLAASQVVDRFERASGGTRLRGTATPDVAWDQLGLGLNATPRQQRRYGTFSIYVVDPEREDALASLLADKDTAKPLEQTEDGVYWDLDELADSYVAYKRYGPNIVLSWWNERAEPVTDARFERLDALMRQLTTD